MGYEVSGLVNGPNEGYPEYEVTQATLDLLISHQQSNAPNPIPSAPEDPNVVDLATNPIDPALLGHDNSGQIGRQENETSQTTTILPPPQATITSIDQATIGNSSVRPTTPLDNTAGVATAKATHKTLKKRLGKRPQANLSPQKTQQAERTVKKKKMTGDDLAALEAQNMVQSGSKRRSKPTQRK
jgi:hypothetical protein